MTGFLCTGCNSSFPRTTEHFTRRATSSDGLNNRCRACTRANTAKWLKANPERQAILRKRHRALKPECEKPGRQAYKRRRRQDYRLALFDGLIAYMCETLRGVDRGITYSQLIGCDASELSAHIEAQFRPGMCWTNRRHWHVDHIVPFAAVDLHDRAQLRAVCHFSNLQPLWASENSAKGASLNWQPTSAGGSA